MRPWTDAIENLVAHAERYVTGFGNHPDALLPSAQLAIAFEGDLVIEATIGAPIGTRYAVFSVTKAVVAGAVWLLIGEGRLRPSTRVTEVIPEFGTNGKETVTVEHLLTHTAGFPSAVMGPPEWSTRESRIAMFACWVSEWPPGSRMAYHPTSAHWVLAELITSVTGTDYRDFIFEHICVPLGLERMRVGATECHPDRWDDVAKVVLVGEDADADDPAARLPGVDLRLAADRGVVRLNEDSVRDLGSPSGGGIARAGDLALYFQALLHNPSEMWRPGVLAQGTSNVLCTMPDPLLSVPANRTLGLMVAGDDGLSFLRGFGSTVGPRTFGHLGSGCQVAWADPDSGVSFCFVTAGHDVNLLRAGLRLTDLNDCAGALS